MCRPRVAPPPQPIKPVRRFTVAPTVEESLELDDPDARRQRLIQIVLLTLTLAALLAGVWYLMQPATVDALYERIVAAASDENPERLVEVEPQVQEFLQRFPEDARREEIEDFQSAIDDHRAETLSRNLVRRLSRKTQLAPVERAYLTAIAEAQLAPERSVAKLQAFLTLYSNQPGISRDGERCVEAARRKLKQLKVMIALSTEAHAAFLSNEMRRAEAASESDPEQARAIWRALVELYDQQPWAAETVSAARARLATGGSAEKP